MSTLSSEDNQTFLFLSECGVVTDLQKRLTPAMAMKHGFASVEEYKANVQKKFSLLETGIIHRPSTRLLLINVGCPFFRPRNILDLSDWNRARWMVSCPLRTR